ncbi:MAG: S41 family peptidase [Phycisphaerales bacterium]|nr:MAG: S41 family peptidase [Phycisphaerales bacterium]
MRIKQTLAPILLITLFAALLVQLPIAIAARAGEMEWFDPIIDVRRIILDDFVTEPDEPAMQLALINGMLESLEDPHTVYVPYEEVEVFNKDLRGEYVGIGAEVNVIDDYLTIISPMDGSPALQAGVLAGDVVLVIEGQSTFHMPVTDAIDLLMGEPDTPVTIRVRHLDGAEEDITIIRGHIVTQTVKGLRRRGEEWDHCVDADLGLFYVRITQFNDSTVGELRSALNRLQGQNMNGLVLDLRDNPGGGLLTAVAVSDLFLSEGDVVSVKSRTGNGRTFGATAEGTLPEFPMVVLINGASASASEIVAGALQENHRAKVLGTRSFGKGSVQEVRELEHKRGTLKFTTAHYYLPGGRNINRKPDSGVWGVDPDPGFVKAISDEDYIARFRARREYEIIREPGNGNGPGSEPMACVDPQWIRDNLLDEQLACGVEALQTRVRGGDWPAVSDDDSALAALGQELNRALETRLRLQERLIELEDRIGELQQLADEAGAIPLLPPDVDLVDGKLAVYDKHGNLIGEYKIEGGNLELALDSVALRPIGADVDQ